METNKTLSQETTKTTNKDIIEIIFELTDETTTPEKCKQIIDSLDNDSVCTILNLQTVFDTMDDYVNSLLVESFKKFTPIYNE